MKKICRRCGLEKDISQFYKYKTRLGIRYQATCKACRKEKMDTARYNDNPYKHLRDIKVTKVLNSNFIDDITLTYELVLSEGKGQPTQYLLDMIQIMIAKISTKFFRIYNFVSHEDMLDIMSETFLFIIDTKIYRNYNSHKFSKSIPYMTEIIKRRLLFELGKSSNKGISGGWKKITYIYE
jgi:hypothetical protein